MKDGLINDRARAKTVSYLPELNRLDPFCTRLPTLKPSFSDITPAFVPHCASTMPQPTTTQEGVVVFCAFGMFIGMTLNWRKKRLGLIYLFIFRMETDLAARCLKDQAAAVRASESPACMIL